MASSASKRRKKDEQSEAWTDVRRSSPSPPRRAKQENGTIILNNKQSHTPFVFIEDDDDVLDFDVMATVARKLPAPNDSVNDASTEACSTNLRQARSVSSLPAGTTPKGGWLSARSSHPNPRHETKARQPSVISLDNEEDDSNTNKVPRLAPMPATPTKRFRVEASRLETVSLPTRRTPTPEHRLSPGANMLWADKYAPKCKDDLAIQPKRVADVSAAVVRAIVDSQAPPASIGYEASRLHVIILTGPPGCGKSAMMRCLATDLSELSGQPRAFELVEWTNPTGFRFDSLSHGAGPKVNYRSELPEFIDTISYRHVYPSLELSGPTLTSKSLPKLLLVEDLPNLHTITQQEQFRAAVRSFCESKIYQPIVFIISDDTEGSSPLRSIFGDGVLELPEVQVIRIKDASKKTCQYINKILKSEGLSGAMNAGQVAQIVESCAGDTRSAINTVQWHCISRIEPLPANNKVTRTKGKKDPTQHVGVGRDVSLSLFHAIGKVLYNKRLRPDGSEAEGDCGMSMLRQLYQQTPAALASPQNLQLSGPQHLSLSVDSPLWRPPMKSLPEAILDHNVYSESSLFVDFLHENYLHFFTDTDEAERAANALAIVDMLPMKWQTSGYSMGNYSALISMYGVMHANTRQAPRSFHQFSKPRLASATREGSHERSLSNLIFRSERHAPKLILSGPGGVGGLSSCRHLATETLPYMRLLVASPRFSHPFSASEFEYIKSACMYSSPSSAESSRNRKPLSSTSTESAEEILGEGKRREKARLDALTKNILSPASQPISSGVLLDDDIVD